MFAALSTIFVGKMTGSGGMWFMGTFQTVAQSRGLQGIQKGQPTNKTIRLDYQRFIFFKNLSVYTDFNSSEDIS